MVVQFLPLQARPPVGSVVLFLVATICMAGAIHLYVTRAEVEQSKITEPAQDIGGNRNQTGNIDGNRGIFTQGQTGDNAISK
jgi:hypothetical protein